VWCENYWVRQSLMGKAVLVLAPGSGSREKNWPVTSYSAISEWWRQRTEGAVVVLVGPVEEERGGLDLLLSRAVVARKPTLAQAAALLARSDLYLGNDSGISHLAAAVGVPTVALFGPTDARQWAPRGETVTHLSRDVECSPCEIPVMKRCSQRKCLTSFYPMDVITQLEKLAEVATLTRGGSGVKV
jgi:ADP-heptose:LPS heptosyltransferase